MPKKPCRRSRLLVGGALGCVVVGVVGMVTSAERAKLDDGGVVSPPNQAVLLSGSFDVICKAGDVPLKVDSAAFEWESFELPLRVARVRLAPGLHELRIGDRRLEVVVALNEEEHDGPEDWKIYRSHPLDEDATRCEDCHQTKERKGRISVGELKSYEACLECHTPVDFEVIHAHILEPLEPCQMCHALHGSHYKSLLKAPVRKLCEECHDPDH